MAKEINVYYKRNEQDRKEGKREKQNGDKVKQNM